MSKKIIICLALMCALIMTACANPEPGEQVPGDDQPVGTTPADTTPAETTPSATETTAPATDPTKITVSLDGTTDYMIIRADNAQGTIVSAAAKLFLKLKDDVGIQTKINTDWAKDESTIDQSAPEIIVGKTNRTACAPHTEAIEDRTFIIRVVDDKLLIAGATDKLTGYAVDYFIENYLSNPEYCSEGKLVLPRDLNDVQGPLKFEMTDLINSTDSYVTSHEKVLDIAKYNGHRIMQGGCTDGKYCYFALNDGDVKAYIFKYSVDDWKLVARSEVLPLDHSNDICYNPDTHELIVVHNAPNRDTISRIDPDTLEIKETRKIPYTIFSMAYNATRQMYVVGLSGGQNFATMDANFKPLKKYIANNTGYTTQGVECDDDFIYFVQYKQNVIMIYDWDGKFVTRIDLSIQGEEPENISLVEGEFIIGCNNASWSGGVVYRLNIQKKQ